MTADEKTTAGAELSETAGVELSDTAGPEQPGNTDSGEGGEKPGPLKRFAGDAKQRWSGKIAAGALTLLVVAAVALLGGLFWFQYRADRATNAAAAKAAISAATEGTVAVLSYSPDTLDHDFSSAKSHLTGDFLSYYDQFTSQIVAPAAKQKSVKTNAVVLRAAISAMHPDSADVLLFVNQSTQSKERPEPAFTSSSVAVTLTKAHGNWLISSFSPL